MLDIWTRDVFRESYLDPIQLNPDPQHCIFFFAKIWILPCSQAWKIFLTRFFVSDVKPFDALNCNSSWNSSFMKQKLSFARGGGTVLRSPHRTKIAFIKWAPLEHTL